MKKEYSDLMKDLSIFDDNNVFKYNFFVLVNPDSAFIQHVSELRKKFNDIIVVPQLNYYDAHLTLLFGIKFNRLTDLFNFVIHIRNTASKNSLLYVDNPKVSMFKDPQTIVTSFRASIANKLRCLRKSLLEKSNLFSDVLSYPFLVYSYNRYFNYAHYSDNDSYKPHIGLIYFFHYKNIFKLHKIKSDIDYVYDYVQDHIGKNVSEFSFDSLSLVCSSPDDGKWHKVVEFKLRG